MYCNILISSNLERSLEISNICRDILFIHPMTRCSSFINRNGRIVESKFRDNRNITSLTRQELEMLYMQCKLQSSMNEEFDEKLGRLNYTLIRRESSLHFIFPFFDGIIFVIMDNEIAIQGIVNKISELIIKYEFDLEVKKLQ